MLARLGFPDITGHRRFVAAIAVDAVGSGVYLPVSTLYFVRTAGLPLEEVGLALSLAAAFALPVVLVVGQLVDRVGPRRILLCGNVIQALASAGYLVAHTWPQALLCLTLTSIGQACFWGSFGPTVAALSRMGEREVWFGFLGALRNMGFAVGGLVTGAAITAGSVAAFHALAAANAASYLLSFALLLGVRLPRHVPETDDAVVRDTAVDGWRTVLRDKAFRVAVLGQVGYCLSSMTLNLVMPVYVLEVLHLPGWVAGAIYTINTAIVGFGQGLVVRQMHGRVRWRMLLLADALFVLAYLVLASAATTLAVGSVVLVLVATTIYTLGEAVGGPVRSAINVEAAPEHLRGRYLSVTQLTWNVTGIVAPLAYTWLVAHGRVLVWLVLAGGAAVLSVLSPLTGRVLPAARRVVTSRAVGASD